MRIIPANFDEIEEKYISGLAKLVHQYKILSDLVYEQDEINAQFVSNVSDKGAKLVHQYKIPPDLVYEQDEINAQFVSDNSKSS